MLTINNKVLKINGDWLKSATAPQIVYNVILNQTTGGTISAQPMNGVNGTTVTLSNTPATNYTFSGYNISGSTLYDTNKFDINGSDVTCSANWNYNPVSDEVQIGNQIWAKYNLAVDDGQGGIIIQDNTTINGYNLGSQYYYTWEAAVRVANTIQGWHLPTIDEFDTLMNTVSYETGGKKLKSTYAWSDNGNGTDDYGFCVLPLGYYRDSSSSFTELGTNSHMWSISTPTGGTNAYNGKCYSMYDIFTIYDGLLKTYYTSVRLIKDS